MSNPRYVPVNEEYPANVEGEPMYAPAPAPVNAAPLVYPAHVAPQPMFAPPASFAVPNLVIPPIPNMMEFEERLRARKVIFHMSAYLNDAWGMVKSNFCSVFAFWLVFILLIVGFACAAAGIQYALGVRRGDMEWEWENDYKVTLAMIGLQWFAEVFVFFPLSASCYIGVFNAMRTDGNIKFSDITTGYSRFGRMALWGTATYLISQILSFLLVVPAIIFHFFTVFAMPIYLEHPSFVGVFKSYGLSSRVVSQYVCDILAYMVVSVLLVILGLLCFVVGVLVAAPVVFIGACFMYHHLVGVNGCPLAPGIVFHPAPIAMHPVMYGQPVAPAQVQYPHGFVQNVPMANAQYHQPHYIPQATFAQVPPPQ